MNGFFLFNTTVVLVVNTTFVLHEDVWFMSSCNTTVVFSTNTTVLSNRKKPFLGNYDFCVARGHEPYTACHSEIPPWKDQYSFKTKQYPTRRYSSSYLVYKEEVEVACSLKWCATVTTDARSCQPDEQDVEMGYAAVVKTKTMVRLPHP